MTTHTEHHDVREQLKALIRLQHIDSRLDQIRQLRGDLPEYIQDLEDERAGLQTRIEKYKEEAAESEAERSRAERSIQESQAAIKRYEEQQLQVRNNREYDALTKEIEAQRQRIAENEQRIEDLKVRDEANASAIVEAEQRLEDLDELIAAKKDELRVVSDETQQEEDRLGAQTEEAASAVEDRYLNAYQRLRRRLRDGRAVVPLERGAASGFAVPPQRQVEVRQQNKIVVCEHTGRIIVDRDLFEESVSELAL